MRKKQAGQSTGIAINGDKATRWLGGREKYNMQVQVKVLVCGVKLKCGMSGMRGLHREIQVGIM